MKKLLPFVCFALLLQGCATQGVSGGKSEIFGKVTVLNTNGTEMTEFCRSTLDGNGLLVQKAATGSNKLVRINCLSGNYMYRIAAETLSVNVPSDNVAVDFGSIVIKLNPSGAYNVEQTGSSSSHLYSGSLPVKSGQLNTSGVKTWVKNYIGGSSRF